MPSADPIQHVVTLMLENRSFDQMLGCMKEVHPELEGVDIDRGEVHLACDYPDRNNKIAQLHVHERFSDPDPVHEHINVLRQLDPDYGFIVDYLQAYPHVNLEKKSEVMGFYPRGFLRILHHLAESFAVCDHWFSSLPGPTWPNRFFIHSGTANGHVTMPNGVFDKNWHFYDQVTLYDRLCERKISWKIYHQGMPQSLVMLHQLEHANHYHDMTRSYQDAAGPAHDFPQYSFIEPAYRGAEQNDQHPPSDIMQGELLLANVYNALAANEELWNSTLFVFLYDEHGGFYDHLTPPKAIPPDDKISEYRFDRYGVRVPAVLISPWIEKGVIKTVFDHTSLLAYLTEKWAFGGLGDRTKKAAHFGSELLKLGSARTDIPRRLDLAQIPSPQPTRSKHINEHQRALISFSHFLEQHIGDSAEEVGKRALRILDGVDAQFEVAMERFGYAAPGSIQRVICGAGSGFNGITESRSFNNRVETTSIQASSSAGTGLNLGFAYSLPGGNNGNVSSITDNRDTGRSLPTISYDPLSRIIQAKTQATSGTDCWGENFTLDGVSNLYGISLAQCSGWTLSATVNSNNQLTPTPTYSYDLSGNMTSDGTGYAYTFDGENHLHAANGTPLGNYTYTYDGNGLRVEKTNGSTGTLYWRGLTGDALSETDLSGNIINEYVFFGGRRVALRNGSGNVYFYNSDQVGTTRTITDSTGNICYDSDFTPYGVEIVQHTNSCSQNYKFTGYERDAETGLDYAFARYYSPSLGRFLSPDPQRGSLSDPQSLNRYAYTRNNPTNLVDPTGMVNIPAYRGLGSGGGGGGYFGFLMNLYFALGYGSMGGGSCQADGVDTSCNMVSELLDSGAAVRCPNNFCGGAENGNDLRYTADARGVGFYSCIGAGQFDTQQAAGVAAVTCTNGPSIYYGREYLGNIYQIDSSGKYSFTLGNAQGPSGGYPDFSDIPDDTEYAGNYHTHGAGDLEHYGEQFSGFANDIGIALSLSNQFFPNYLGTPQGRIEMFDPNQFFKFPNGCVLLGPPVSPGPGVSLNSIPTCGP